MTVDRSSRRSKARCGCSCSVRVSGFRHDSTGCTRSGGRYRLDFAWPDRKLGLECDSWEHHGDRVAFGKDRERLSEMVALGWRVLLVTWDIGTRQPRASSDGSEMALAA